jgi:hypothetical protein
MWCASHSGLLLSNGAFGVLATLGSYSVMGYVMFIQSGPLITDGACGGLATLGSCGVLATLGSYSLMVHEMC